MTGYLEGTIDDWPANIQDVIFKALERCAAKVQLPLKIVHSRCDRDHDVPGGVPGMWYLHVVASEIVMADERTVRQEIPDYIKNLLN